MSARTCRHSARPPIRLFHLVFESHDGRALCADSVEKHEPASDIDTVAMDGLKALDPSRPIREADISVCTNCVFDLDQIQGRRARTIVIAWWSTLSGLGISAAFFDRLVF
jgi:hypothetical protein